MNIRPDPSYELDTLGYTREGTATRLNAPGAWPDGDWGLLLIGAPGALGNPATFGRERWTLPTVAGVAYPLSAMVQLALGDAASAPLQVEARTVGGSVLATYTLSAWGGAFAPWSPGSFTATEAQTIVEFRCERPSSGGGATWALDEVEVLGPDGGSDVARHKHEARVALIDLLKGINGSPYWTNFEGRVYTRLFTPDDDNGIARPFGILRQSAPSSSPLTERLADRAWRFRFHAYFHDNRDSDARDTSAATLCDKLEDDLVRALLLNPFLGGKADEVDLEAVYPYYGDDVYSYAEVVADIKVVQRVDANVLGPAAP